MSTDQFIPRGQLLRERIPVSDSTERRRRQSGENWPAHVRVGSRIYYSESSVNSWIAAQTSTGAGPEAENVGRFSPAVEAAIERRAAELAAQAPPLTARQIEGLREIFGNPAGSDVR